MEKSLQEMLEKIYEGKKATATLDLVPLTNEQIEELVNQYQIADEEISTDKNISEDEIENINGVLAKSNGQIIKLDSDFDINEIDGLYYTTHDKSKILYGKIKNFTADEKASYYNLIHKRLKMRSKRRLTEEDMTLPLLLSGRIKPNNWDLLKG